MLGWVLSVKKLVCIKILEEIKSYIPIKITFLPKCGLKSVRQPLFTFNAEYVLGLPEEMHKNGVDLEMKKMPRCNGDRKN